jgi:catechol 2,3-dioxygenase-like lactoylglutathione lyase family enzyme
MIRTHGLTHVALRVRDPRRSFDFYRDLLGAVAVYEDDDTIQAQTPGSRDVLVFERSPRQAGRAGGIVHFGFRLVAPADIAQAKRELARLGAKIVDEGEFGPGQPFVFFLDPDGYEVEVWYEPPTPVDPPDAPKKGGRRA